MQSILSTALSREVAKHIDMSFTRRETLSWLTLLWMLLPTAGNSHTTERTELLDRLRTAFPDMKIAALMGDREFIGNAWMAYLQRQNIAFILRLRENQHVVRAGYVAL